MRRVDTIPGCAAGTVGGVPGDVEVDISRIHRRRCPIKLNCSERTGSCVTKELYRRSRAASIILGIRIVPADDFLIAAERVQHAGLHGKLVARYTGRDLIPVDLRARVCDDDPDSLLLPRGIRQAARELEFNSSSAAV